MQRRLLLLACVILFVSFKAVHSTSFQVTIQSVAYPQKVHPNEKFSITVVVVCNDVNGWVKAKLYSMEQEVKVSEGAWYGWLGTDAGKNATLVLSDTTLAPNAHPYALEVVTFWQPLSQGELRQDSRQLSITAVTVTLSADCLPNSVKANQDFTLECSITNSGNDVAHAVVAAIVNYGDFSPRGRLHGEIGDIAAGESKPISFNMASPTPISGGVYKMILNLTCSDFAGRHLSTTQELPIKVEISPPEAVMTWWPAAILAVVIIAVLLFAFTAKKMIFRRKGELEFRR